jgi:hypothetical protein
MTDKQDIKIINGATIMNNMIILDPIQTNTNNTLKQKISKVVRRYDHRELSSNKCNQKVDIKTEK